MNNREQNTFKPGVPWRRIARVTRIFLISAVALVVTAYAALAFIGSRNPYGTMAFGATFSKDYAEFLGLDWRAVYTAMFDDLGIHLVRVPAYWTDIEPQPGHYDFTDVDWQIAEASKRNVKVILATGMKLPRWPECYLPSWAAGMSETEIHARTLAMIQTVVERYRGEKVISDWQVENEPLLPFGICPASNPTFLKEEVAAVHALDKRPVVLQDAGEFSYWVPTARLADTLGVSLYRTVWTKKLGFVRWPAITSAYWVRMALARFYVDRVINTEMQGEPWLIHPITEVSIADQLAQMNPVVLRDNVAFAKRIGFPEVYLWGVEWWYWLKEKGHPEMWAAAKAIVAESQR